MNSVCIIFEYITKLPYSSSCLPSSRELLSQHKENLPTVLKHVIYNELSNARNPNNMALLGALFQHSPEQSAQVGIFTQDIFASLCFLHCTLKTLFNIVEAQINFYFTLRDVLHNDFQMDQ